MGVANGIDEIIRGLNEERRSLKIRSERIEATIKCLNELKELRRKERARAKEAEQCK